MSANVIYQGSDLQPTDYRVDWDSGLRGTSARSIYVTRLALTDGIWMMLKIVAGKMKEKTLPPRFIKASGRFKPGFLSRLYTDCTSARDLDDC